MYRQRLEVPLQSLLVPAFSLKLLEEPHRLTHLREDIVAPTIEIQSERAQSTSRKNTAEQSIPTIMGGIALQFSVFLTPADGIQNN